MHDRPSRAWEALLELADSWRGATLAFALGLVAYWFDALAWPLQRGRDLWDYWLYYLQLGDAHPPFSQVMLFRTPVTPLVVGIPMSIGGARLLEIVMSVIYAASVAAWAWAARPFGRKASILTVVAVLLLQIPYASLFHQASSDFLFGTLLGLWTGLVVRAGLRASWPVLCAVGGGAALLTLTRPASQVLVLAAAVVALVAAGTLRVRAARVAVTLAAAILPLLLWAGVNGIRYDDFTVVRGGKAWVPFFKVAGSTDPANGPASRKLAAAVEQHVLTLPPYHRLDVSVQTYFRGTSNLEILRMIALSDQTFGRASNYDVLFDASLETIRHHPSAYLDSVTTTMWRFLSQRVALEPVRRGQTYPPGPLVKLVDGKPMPTPIAVSPLVPAVAWGFNPCPTNDIDRCILEDPSRAFPSEREQRRYVALTSKVRSWNAELPVRNGVRALEGKMSTLSFNTPPSIVWIVIALAALVLRRPRGGAVLLVLLGAAGLVLLVHALSQAPQAEFELPFAPLFALVAIAALASPTVRRRSVTESRTP